MSPQLETVIAEFNKLAPEDQTAFAKWILEEWEEVKRIKRREAGQRLFEIMDQLQGSLSPEEIEAELAKAKADRIAHQEVTSRS
jgi:hypothetical protein